MPDTPSAAPAAAPRRDPTGDSIPAALQIAVRRDGRWQRLSAGELFGGRDVVLFGLPGAFTPTCSSQHLPRFEQLAPALLGAGIDEIVCAAVNDTHVLDAWADQQQVERVTLLADGNGELASALGQLEDCRAQGYGFRSWRYALVVRDGRIEKAFIEPDEGGDPYGVSDADHVLRHVHPTARPPDEVLLIARAGCPHCARARELLEQAGFEYVEWRPAPLDRLRALGALAGEHTVPQVFINGERIGGADALAARLLGPTGPPEGRST